jgi:hypothetical protein
MANGEPPRCWRVVAARLMGGDVGSAFSGKGDARAALRLAERRRAARDGRRSGCLALRLRVPGSRSQVPRCQALADVGYR